MNAVTPIAKPRVIVCSICARGPMREDGAVALFAAGGVRFCAEHLPLDELRRRRSGVLDPETRAIFDRRGKMASL
jgi:hypothetical protein